jgi:hypothetical protein
VDGGISCIANGVPGEHCSVESAYAGIHVPVTGLRAARFEVTLIEPQNIEGFYVHAQSATDRSVRWRWQIDTSSRRLGEPERFTLVPGSPADRLELVTSTASSRDIRELHVFIAVKPGTRAGFQLRHLEVSEHE